MNNLDVELYMSQFVTFFENNPNDLLDLIQENKLEQARSLLAQLTAELPYNNLELIKAKMFLRKQELKNAQNH